MKAIVLAAGYATRLYPLTKDIPKALLPINGMPIADYIIKDMEEINEIDEIIVVSNDKFFKQFDVWAKNLKTTKKIIVLNDKTTSEENRLGANGDIQFAIDQLKIDDDLLIIASDSYYTFGLKACFDFFIKTDDDTALGNIVEDIEDIKRFAVALTDENGKILDLEEKPQFPKSNLAVFAAYFFKRDTVRLYKTYLDEGNKPDAPGYFLQWLYKRKSVYVVEMKGKFYDIGTPEAYEDVQGVYKQ